MEQERGDDRMDMEETQTTTTTNNGPAPAADGGGGGAADARPDQEGAAAPAVKIGFSFGSSAKRKVSTQGAKKGGDEGRELVTAIQGSTMKTLFEKDDGPLVIPLPQPLRKKTKTSEDGEGKPAPAVMDPKLAGLSAEDREAAEALIKEGKEGVQVDAGADEEDMPLLLKYRLPGLDNIDNEDEKFRFDVESRPEETTASAYDRVPVEKFGEAMLRGMLWKPGDPIGNTNKAVVKPVEFIPRHHRLGLGAAPKAPEPTKKKFIKPGESREPKQMMVLPRDKDGRQRHVRDLDQKLVAFRPEGIHPGNLVGVVTGDHEGMYARIVQILAGDKVRIRFESEEEVTVNRIDLAPLNSTQLKQGHPALGIREGDEGGNNVEMEEQEDDDDADDGDANGAGDDQKGVEWEQATTNAVESKSGSSGKSPSSSSSSTRSDKSGSGSSSKRREDDKKTKKEKSNRREEKKEPVWLRPGITVRIVSKSLGEKYYRKKVKVVDVVAGDICTVMLDTGRILENIRQRQVETVIPDVGRRVVVVLGPDRGKVGKLIQKSTSKETAVVQFEGDWTGEVGTYGLDDISEYRGE